LLLFIPAVGTRRERVGAVGPVRSGPVQFCPAVVFGCPAAAVDDNSMWVVIQPNQRIHPPNHHMLAGWCSGAQEMSPRACVAHSRQQQQPTGQHSCPPHLLKQHLLSFFVQYYLGDLPNSCVECLASPCVCVWVRVRALCLASCFWPLLQLQKIKGELQLSLLLVFSSCAGTWPGPRGWRRPWQCGRVWCRPIIARGRRAFNAIWYCVIPLDGGRSAALCFACC
jgi:hypothetical protein